MKKKFLRVVVCAEDVKAEFLPMETLDAPRILLTEAEIQDDIRLYVGEDHSEEYLALKKINALYKLKKINALYKRKQH